MGIEKNNTVGVEAPNGQMCYTGIYSSLRFIIFN